MPMNPLGGPRIILSKRDRRKKFVGNPLGSRVDCDGEALKSQDLLSFFDLYVEIFFFSELS